MIGIFALVLGLILGSFLNVVIYRLPRGLSLVRPRSFCPRCKHQLRWYENIPLFSYLLQRGRCRSCGAPIDIRYPLVETLSGLLAFYFVSRYGIAPAAVGFYSFSFLLLAAAFIDLEHRIIPDEITLGGIPAGLIFSPWNPLAGPGEALLGALCGAGAFYLLGEYYLWIRKREGLGEGDYKFLAMIGAFLGPVNLIPVIFMASLWGVFGVLITGLFKKEKISGGLALPFGPFLSLGALSVVMFPKLTAFLFPSIH
ncbi:A24 family peptidase [Thermosulfurimonas sp. F29]|uniref:prepilin peptidase n=1 Tax=Thermosulfurimonas sp. F29 TaxID=2867247 RepID=UPI001C8304B5|nr:A24 family peptidase [Thermosulfurimonas sp. F29]MBX6422292.1 prepilin peptidase [Thermosulfurimonas sp. F29]